MPVKIDPEIVAELEALDLVIWEAKHPKQPFFNEKTGKHSQREDKSWCLVVIAGPGVDGECRAGAATLRAAVDAALAYHFPERFTGLKAALLKLGKEIISLNTQVRWQRHMAEDGYDGDPDDYIPF